MGHAVPDTLSFVHGTDALEMSTLSDKDAIELDLNSPVLNLHESRF